MNSGETPDAMGWRMAGHLDGSVVVEVKVSRSDFKADMKKAHRSGDSLGMGNWRYYLCPEGLIVPDDLPEKWGLIYADDKGRVRPVVGPMTTRNYFESKKIANDMWHESDTDRERFALAKLFDRVGDVDELNRRMKGVWAEADHLRRSLADLRETVRLNKESHLVDRLMLEALYKEVSPDLINRLRAEITGVNVGRIP